MSLSYWLREVRDWTDGWVVKADQGMGWGHLPVATGVALSKARLIRKGENGRWIITRAGREKLREE